MNYPGFCSFSKRNNYFLERNESHYATRCYAKWLVTAAVKDWDIVEISLRNLDDDISYKKKIVAGCASEWE